MGRMTKGFLFFGKAARRRQSLFSNVENCGMMRATNFKIRKQRTQCPWMSSGEGIALRFAADFKRIS